MKESENKKNRKRYHEKYKVDSGWMKKRREAWKKYAEKQSIQWFKERSRRYRKSHSKLSPSARSKIRKAYTSWAKRNWEWRVEYAKKYRRKKPGFGLKSKIANARRSGDIRKLAEECLIEIIRADE